MQLNQISLILQYQLLLRVVTTGALACADIAIIRRFLSPCS